MAFKSIWGDMDFGADKKIEKVEVPTEDPKDGEETPEGSEEEEEEEEAPEGAAEDPKKKEDAEEGEDPEEEDYDFSDDDVSKAYTMLEEQGILQLGEDDEVEPTPEGLGSLVKKAIRDGIQEKLAATPEAVKNLYAHLEAGKPIEDFELKAPPAPWADVDEDDEEVQRRAVRQFLLNTGVDEADVDEELDDLIAEGKLGKKAKVALPALVKLEEKEKSRAAKEKEDAAKKAEKAAQEEIDSIKSSIDDIKEIANFKLTDKRKEDFKKYLFDVNPKSGKTQFLENMANEDRKLKIAFLDFIEYTEDDVKKEVGTEMSKNRKKRLAKFSRKTPSNSNGARTVKKQKTTKKLNIPSMFSAPKK